MRALVLAVVGVLLAGAISFMISPKSIVYSRKQFTNKVFLYAVANELGDENDDSVKKTKSWRQRLKEGLKSNSNKNAEAVDESEVIDEEEIQKELIEAGKIDMENLIKQSRNIEVKDVIGVNTGNEDEILDLNLISETAMDQSIERAVKQLLDEGTKAPAKAPTEIFNEMYLNLKDKNSKNSTSLDPEAMLAQLFPDDQTKNPFDERKVMIKLRQMLDKGDFDDLFLDPTIGDWL